MGKILSISIFKGGTGKTTTAVSLSSALAKLGARVLLIDLDQQASATRHVGLNPEEEVMNLFHVFKKQIPAGMAAKELPYGFKIIPGHSLTAAVEAAMEEGDETMLKDLISGLKDQYDYILLDSPPGKGMMALNALTAADEAIIPLQSELLRSTACTISCGSLTRWCGIGIIRTSKYAASCRPCTRKSPRIRSGSSSGRGNCGKKTSFPSKYPNPSHFPERSTTASRFLTRSPITQLRWPTSKWPRSSTPAVLPLFLERLQEP